MLALTMFDDVDHLVAAIRASAGVRPQTARQEEIVRAVNAVEHGEIVFGQPVAARVLAFFGTASPPQSEGSPN